MSKECGAGLVHICLHKTWDACAGIVFCQWQVSPLSWQFHFLYSLHMEEGIRKQENVFVLSVAENQGHVFVV